MKITKKQINEYLKGQDVEGVLLADGLEGAFIGLSNDDFRKPCAVYDRNKCIEILMEDMTRDDAEEHFQFNTAGAWVNDQTPIFVSIPYWR